ncbi:hypothetical protein RND81_05G243600 [Saponaria officinalis]|uniref:Uncharacterized protein n=1 Tax=Saponaria officinalis TaxID=3572 RepID=A0AAW1KW21_SAPOF
MIGVNCDIRRPHPLWYRRMKLGCFILALEVKERVVNRVIFEISLRINATFNREHWCDGIQFQSVYTLLQHFIHSNNKGIQYIYHQKRNSCSNCYSSDNQNRQK